MARAQQIHTATCSARYRALEGRLQSLSPLAVLNRGYALVFKQDGALLKNANQAEEGDLLTIRLAAGSVRSRVVRTQN
jgi:exodeoxyribonuclease VII large subunit